MKTWCIPPTANADFVYHMEDVLWVYQLPYDRRYPVICMDELTVRSFWKFIFKNWKFSLRFAHF